MRRSRESAQAEVIYASYGDVLPEGDDLEGPVAPTQEGDADHAQDGEDEFGHELTSLL